MDSHKTRKKNLFNYIIIFCFFLFTHIAPGTLFLPTVFAQNADGNEINFITPDTNIDIPGVSFTTDETLLKQGTTEADGRTFIQIPFLGEYLAGLYRYAVGVAGTVAVIMIVVAGFQWATSGGSPDVIGSAKDRITNAITGLLLILCSYALLYAINPELVRFRALSIPYISPGSVEFFDKGSIDEPGTPPPSIIPGRTPASSGGRGTAWPVCDNLGRTNPRTGGLPRTGLVIAREGHVSALDVVRCATAAGAVVQSPIAQPTNASTCPLTNPSLVGTNGETQAQYSDALLQKYTVCTSASYELLKAIAWREASSGLNPLSRNGDNFTGLFQTKSRYCQNAVGPSLAQYCVQGDNLETRSGKQPVYTSLLNAEVSTMAGTGFLKKSLELIGNKFPTSCPQQAVMYLAYIGHHNGVNALENILNNMSECSISNACEAMYTVQLSKNPGAGPAQDCSTNGL